MSPTARVGQRFLTILGVTTLLGVGVQAANFAQRNAAQFPELPDSLIGYDRREATPPFADNQRDSPKALNVGYYKGDLPPIHVSVARADSLNAYRAAATYLLDTDGRVLQEATLTRENERIPLYNFLVGSGRSEALLAAQWTQAPGEDPQLDPLDAPGKIAESLMTKRPIFVCNVWIVDRADLKGLSPDVLIRQVATEVDAKIKAMK